MAKTQRQVSFDVTKAEMATIGLIADRAIGVAQSLNVELNKQEVMMDLCAVHANGCPLRLDDLLAADAFNFTHDIGGIRRHLNRETGQLENCFSPRFSA